MATWWLSEMITLLGWRVSGKFNCDSAFGRRVAFKQIINAALGLCFSAVFKLVTLANYAANI